MGAKNPQLFIVYLYSNFLPRSFWKFEFSVMNRSTLQRSKTRGCPGKHEGFWSSGCWLNRSGVSLQPQQKFPCIFRGYSWHYNSEKMVFLEWKGWFRVSKFCSWKASKRLPSITWFSARQMDFQALFCHCEGGTEPLNEVSRNFTIETGTYPVVTFRVFESAGFTILS